MNREPSISKFGTKGNNEMVFSSLDKKVSITKDVDKLIDDIFNSRNFIYKADVVITTNSGSIDETIVGRKNGYLINNNGELIPIRDIIDIEKKQV